MPPTSRPSINVRMYRHGLGDCFLVTFKQKGKTPVNMLVDCGVIQGTPNAGNIMRQVAQDIHDNLPTTVEVKGKQKKFLDHVVLTHEHYDHTSGFSLAKAVFEEMAFGQVWTSWLDDKAHPSYRSVRERFRKQILGLTAAIAKMNSEGTVALKQSVQHILSDFFDDQLLGAGDDLDVRSPAWDFALSHSQDEPRYCVPGTTFTLPDLEEFRFYVLGPPEDYDSFVSVNPPEDETYRGDSAKFAIAESFFAAVREQSNLFDAELCQPFEPHLRVDRKAAQEGYPFFEEHYGFADALNDWRRIDDDWLMTAGGLALNLDTYTNNTCLAIAIELVDSGQVLLFPGDAQFANWKSWQKLVFTVPMKNGGNKKVDIRDLLDRTVLYKVGHHGSHNATLKTHGLELMNSPRLSAMIPVDRAMARSKTSKKNPHGWEMPAEKLFERLVNRTRGRVILADEADKSDLRKRCREKAFVTRTTFGGRLIRDNNSPDVTEPLYVELQIR